MLQFKRDEAKTCLHKISKDTVVQGLPNASIHDFPHILICTKQNRLAPLF